MNGVVHFEIPVEDMEKASEWYKKVFKWNTEKYPGDMPYVLARTCECDEQNMPKETGKINGGFYKRDESGASKSPVIVIKVENIDEGMEKIKSEGGEIVREKVSVGDMGFYAQFKDPDGNIMGVWQDLK
jgi:uncharacterized protein